MTRCYEDRLDLASYALGLLDERECARVEAHLARCDDCALELEGMLPASALLAGVDRAATLAALADEPEPLLDADTGYATPPWSDPAPLPRYARPTGLPAAHRRIAPPQGWRLAALLGAAAAVIGIGVVIGLLPSDGGPAQVSAGPVTAGATAIGSAGAGGRSYWAVNPGTGTRLDITLASRQWGTHMTFDLSEGRGPLRCRLVTIDTRGGVEVVSSWQVPPEGFGTQAHPERLSLQANSSLPIAQIARVDVEALDQADRPTVLLDLAVQ
jgi:anti-sigma factor RsiW